MFIVYGIIIYLSTVRSDIFPPPTSVTVEPGATGTEVIISPLIDERYEAEEESLTVRIVSVSSGSIDEERQEATVTILDGDGELYIYF